MRAFSCNACGQIIFFENTACLRCSSPLGFDPEAFDLVALRHGLDDGDGTDVFVPVDGLVDTGVADTARVDTGSGDSPAGAAQPGGFRRCANSSLAACNWLVPADAGAGALCSCCRLTTVRPNDGDHVALAEFAAAEAAKRRLVFQLLELGLPVRSRADDPQSGLAFQLLSSGEVSVVTGHEDGVITLDLAEGDDAHRERVRLQLGEAYRTLLGHVRHEIGHYYWPLLVHGPFLDRFAALFGDHTMGYELAIERHYQEGPPVGWEASYVSAYATMHPWEDWAETFAHYLHIRDTLQTAAEFGMVVTGPAVESSLAHELVAVPRLTPEHDFTAILGQWLPLTYALNAVNRSMGKDDLYPFVLSSAVVAKLEFVHDAVAAAVADGTEWPAAKTDAPATTEPSPV